MKKLTVISFLFIFALGQCGYYCFHAFQLYQAKKEARNNILRSVPEYLLTKINIADNQEVICWEDEGKEFRMHGKMYDVVRIKNEDGKLFVICVSDDKEDAILESLVKTIASNIDNGSNSKKNHSSGKVIVQDWIFEAEHAIILPANFCAGIKKGYFNYKSSTGSGFIEIISPPPNLNS